MRSTPSVRHGLSRAWPFLVGGAINRAFSNYSAYSLGKIDLVKFCELIHNECHDIHAVAVGTGWVATKIHRQTIEAGDLAGDNLVTTRGFLSTGKRERAWPTSWPASTGASRRIAT